MIAFIIIILIGFVALVIMTGGLDDGSSQARMKLGAQIAGEFFSRVYNTSGIIQGRYRSTHVRIGPYVERKERLIDHGDYRRDFWGFRRRRNIIDLACVVSGNRFEVTETEKRREFVVCFDVSYVGTNEFLFQYSGGKLSRKDVPADGIAPGVRLVRSRGGRLGKRMASVRETHDAFLKLAMLGNFSVELKRNELLVEVKRCPLTKPADMRSFLAASAELYDQCVQAASDEDYD